MTDPQITNVEPSVIDTRCKPLVFVLVTTEEGIAGLGKAARNAAVAPVAVALRSAGDHVVGSSAFDTEALFERVYEASILAQASVNAGPNDLTHTTR